MPAQRFRGPVLPDGEARDLYVVDGTVTYEPQAGAETVAEGWLVPGLVDAHNHLGLEDDGAVDDDEIERAGGRSIATPASCCCATAARRPTPAGCSSATTCPA